MEKRASRRNYAIDGAKLIAAFFIVFIHYELSGEAGQVVRAIARFAVPFFFLCSGYFLYGNSLDRILKKAKHILKIFVLSALVYAAADILFDGAGEYLAYWKESKNIAMFFLLNVTHSSTHLWFLPALLYVYLGVFLLGELRVPEKWVFIGAWILLALHLVIWEIVLASGWQAPTPIVRNFLFMGFPFVGIGMMMKKYRAKLPELSPAALAAVLAFGAAECALSYLFLGFKSLYLGAIINAAAVLAFSINARGGEKLFRNAGACSMTIYLFHPLIRKILITVGYRAGLDMGSPIWVNLMPFIVCVLSLLFAVAVEFFRRKLQRGA